MSWIKDILFGKVVVRKFELNDAAALLTDKNGQTFTLSRSGYLEYCFGSWWVMNGSSLLESYLNNCKRVIVADNGIVPTHMVLTIDVEKTLRTEEISEREGGWLL